MYVRVYDKPNNRYYKSMAYCVVNIGYDRHYIVLNPYEDRFELVAHLDKSTKEYQLLVETIQFDTDEWEKYEKAYLLKYKHYCKAHGKDDTVELLWGYRDVCENFEFISSILENKFFPVEGSGIMLRELTDTADWNYILTQQDADEFMKLFVGFHDSTLDKIVFEDQQVTSSAIATFDNSGWYGIIELCFEKIVAVNIRPVGENYTPYIYEATLIVKDETVFWADDHMKTEDLSYEGSYIKALSMKWRKIG